MDDVGWWRPDANGYLTTWLIPLEETGWFLEMNWNSAINGELKTNTFLRKGPPTKAELRKVVKEYEHAYRLLHGTLPPRHKDSADTANDF